MSRGGPGGRAGERGGGTVTGGAGGRPQRADARTNRVRVLDAAEEGFGRGGESASTDEGARLAGVGIATVFRHFPTKAVLLEAALTRPVGRPACRGAGACRR